MIVIFEIKNTSYITDPSLASNLSNARHCILMPRQKNEKLHSHWEVLEDGPDPKKACVLLIKTDFKRGNMPASTAENTIQAMSRTLKNIWRSAESLTRPTRPLGRRRKKRYILFTNPRSQSPRKVSSISLAFPTQKKPIWISKPQCSVSWVIIPLQYSKTRSRKAFCIV